MRILKGVVREPVDAYLRSMSGGNNTLRLSIKQRSYGEARAAIVPKVMICATRSSPYLRAT